MTVPRDLIPVTDLKQWAYCQRIVYYHRVMPAVGKTSFKMREAIQAQDLIESLETRRTIGRYGLEDAERHFNVSLRDDQLGLSGKADLILESPNEVAVVDFKLTSGELGDNHRMQLTAYALIAERLYQKASPLAFLYRIPDSKVMPLEITQEMRNMVLASVHGIHHMVISQAFPDATTVRGRCVECEYANYCADIW
jgi:CRISPR-associated exonuclease Cas4